MSGDSVGEWLFTPRDNPRRTARDDRNAHSDDESHRVTPGQRTEDFRLRRNEGGHYGNSESHRQTHGQHTEELQPHQHEARDGRGRPKRHSLSSDEIPPSHNWVRSDQDRTRYFVHIANENRTLIHNLLQAQNHLGERLRKSRTSATLHIKPSSFSHHMYPKLPPAARVQVVPLDSLDVADGLRANGVPEQDIVVLNMANEQTPGGWYLSGAGAQEEALCRRTSLYLTIGPEHGFHPIQQPGAIFSPDVLVMRKSDELDCTLLLHNQMWWTSVISVAAVFRPPVSFFGNDFARMEDKEDMRNRIRTLFRVIAWSGKRNLILSALGCGAFRNPPEAVAKLFKEVLQGDEFCGRFQGIWFAILDRKGSRNFDAFKKVFDKLVV